jgi:hypothetical protein
MVVAQALVDAATEKTTVATGDLMFIESGGTASRITVGNYTASIGVNDKLNASDVLDEDDMATDSATQPPSQQSVKAYVDSLVPGVGQTWADETDNRDLDTEYTNTTGRTIKVKITVQFSNDAVAFLVGGIEVSRLDTPSGAGVFVLSETLEIPDGVTYRANNVRNSATLIRWAEW